MPYKNTIANLLGQMWTAIMGIAFIPLFIKFLGIEAWGIIGFISVLQATLALLDVGMTPTLSREMARYTANAVDTNYIRKLLRSLEIIYIGICLAICVSLWLSSNLIANYWFNSSTISSEVIALAISVIGIIVSSRMVEQVYRGAIQGVQKQIWLNSANSLLMTLRWAGAAIIVVYVEASLEGFLYWQAMVSILSVSVLLVKTYSIIPKANKNYKFDFSSLRQVKDFAGGVGVITLLSVVLTQVDKFLISKLAALSDFGYYMFAISIAGALFFLISPIITAISPYMVELITKKDLKAVAEIYNKASQWLALIIIPPAFLMIGFAEKIIFLWSGDQTLAVETAPYLRFLAFGNLVNGFMNMPYMLQIAYGWTDLMVKANIVAIALLIPFIFIFVPLYGAISASIIWCILNVGYVFFVVHFMHEKIIEYEKWIWYKNAVFVPLSGAGIVLLMLIYLTKFPENTLLSVLILMVYALLLVCVISVITPAIRTFFLEKATHAVHKFQSNK